MNQFCTYITVAAFEQILKYTDSVYFLFGHKLYYVLTCLNLSYIFFSENFAARGDFFNLVLVVYILSTTVPCFVSLRFVVVFWQPYLFTWFFYIHCCCCCCACYEKRASGDSVCVTVIWKHRRWLLLRRLLTVTFIVILYYNILLSVTTRKVRFYTEMFLWACVAIHLCFSPDTLWLWCVPDIFLL